MSATRSLTFSQFISLIMEQMYNCGNFLIVILKTGEIILNHDIVLYSKYVDWTTVLHEDPLFARIRRVSLTILTKACEITIVFACNDEQNSLLVCS